MSTPPIALDRPTLESQLNQLISGHKDLVSLMSQRIQRAADLQKELDGVRSEVEQYKGALSYSQHIQEQTKKALEQAVAAEMAAKQAADGAAKAIASETAASPVLV